MLRAGIVGLPNVGKSTLFNAVTRTRKAPAANYPFCTIDPNVGVVVVPDARLEVLAGISKARKIIPATVEIVDIAGLVRGASQGEGLGNQFLAHIREVDAIVQVVRCFEDADIHHVSGSVDPLRDIEVILTELILADLASVTKQKDRLAKTARTGDKKARAEIAVIEKLEPHLNAGKPALTLDLGDDEKSIARGFFLLSGKPTIFASNVKESDLAALAGGDRDGVVGGRVKQVEDYCATHLGAEAVIISAQIESELIDLEPDEQRAFLADLGVAESGVGTLIRAVYHLLGLRTYFTTGEKETRAWTIHAGDKAPAAAGVIHSDFERGFIAAECMAYADLSVLGSEAKCREAGKLRVEGKEYTVQDGDVMEFRFNV
ncbi:MAG: redox-regulated ATPase YchF [Verrucomicrobiales bacterium]|jgi:GTP-binding protein YchF|nr:redox-regulated ATPase YchF [Verrucomicrobiales bacterium]